MTTCIPTDHITDDYMNNRIAQARTYALVVLKPTAEYFAAGSRPIVWEHGRRNMALQAAGIMPIVCPWGTTRSPESASSTPTPTRLDPSWPTTLASGPGYSPSRSTPAAVSPATPCPPDGAGTSVTVSQRCDHRSCRAEGGSRKLAMPDAHRERRPATLAAGLDVD